MIGNKGVGDQVFLKFPYPSPQRYPYSERFTIIVVNIASYHLG